MATIIIVCLKIGHSVFAGDLD